MTKIKELSGLSAIIERYKEKGEVLEIEKEVDSECELTGIISKLNSLPRTPGVVFKNVKGYDFPCAACLLSEKDRTREILGLPVSPREFKEAFIEATGNPIPSVQVSEAPCKEQIYTSDFDVLQRVPSVKVTPHDGGKYFQPLIISKDPDTGVQSVAINRAMILKDNTVALNVRNESGVGNNFLKYKREGKPFEVALVMGVPLDLYISAATKLPLGQDELGSCRCPQKEAG